MNKNVQDSRFVRRGDERCDSLLLPLPKSWWSRPYEYCWAKNFFHEGATVLDAACGVSHPFKFYLAAEGAQVDACDIDERILDDSAIREDIRNDFGPDADTKIPPEAFSGVHFALGSLFELPYESNRFDTVFCISVLEHLKDPGNRRPALASIPLLGSLFRGQIFAAIAEFKRVLKPEGLLVLTFDYPRINLRYLRTVVRSTGMEFVGPTDFSVPSDALHSGGDEDLMCFRALLRKTGSTSA